MANKRKKSYLSIIKDDFTRFMLVILVVIVLVPLSEIVYYRVSPLSHFLKFESFTIQDSCVGEDLDIELKRKVNDSYSADVVEELKIKEHNTRVSINLPDRQRTILIEDTSYQVNIKQPAITEPGTYKKLMYRRVNLPFGNAKSLTVESNEFEVKNCN